MVDEDAGLDSPEETHTESCSAEPRIDKTIARNFSLRPLPKKEPSPCLNADNSMSTMTPYRNRSNPKKPQHMSPPNPRAVATLKLRPRRQSTRVRTNKVTFDI